MKAVGSHYPILASLIEHQLVKTWNCNNPQQGVDTHLQVEMSDIDFFTNNQYPDTAQYMLLWNEHIMASSYRDVALAVPLDVVSMLSELFC